MAEPVTLQPDDVIDITPHFRLQWEEAQQTHVLLYPEGMVQLSETAAEILLRCRTATSLAQIIDDVQSQFPDDDIATDVREFLEEAHANGWVRIQRAE